MAATTMQQDGLSSFLGPYGASSEAGTQAAADNSSNTHAPAADNTDGLDSTPPKAPSESQKRESQNRKQIRVSRLVYPVI